MSESMKDYEKELEASFKRIEEGDIITGTVISVELLAIISVIVLIYGIFKNLVLQKTQMICMQIMILFEQTVSALCRKKKL